jgi:hypothetical protein
MHGAILYGLFIVVCQHIVITQMVYGHVSANKSKAFTSQPNAAKKKLYKSPLKKLRGCVQTALYKKWIHVVFSEQVYQSEHEAVKTFSVVLKMSENSLNILRMNI